MAWEEETSRYCVLKVAQVTQARVGFPWCSFPSHPRSWKKTLPHIPISSHSELTDSPSWIQAELFPCSVPTLLSRMTRTDSPRKVTPQIPLWGTNNLLALCYYGKIPEITNLTKRKVCCSSWFQRPWLECPPL